MEQVRSLAAGSGVGLVGFVARWAVALAVAVAMLVVSVVPAFAAVPAVPAVPVVPVVPARSIAELPSGEFLESVAIDSKGVMYVTSVTTARIFRITGTGAVSTYAQFPTAPPADPGSPFPGAFVGTVAFGPDGVLYATYVHTQQPELSGIYRVTAGERVLVARFPEGSNPNGITIDWDGTMYVADSGAGIIWRARPGDEAVEAWVQDPLLAPDPEFPAFPGANGVKRFRDSLYVSNSGTAQVVRVPIRRDGSAGTPTVHASGVAIDDFAIDVRGTIYATTHPFNTLVRVHRNGTHDVLAGVDQGMIGPTAAAFGTRPGDRSGLYVATDGGLFGALLDPSSPQGPPSVVRLDVGVPGLPLPGTVPGQRPLPR